MRPEAVRIALKALEVRAADAEAQRQAAIQRVDGPAREAAERELQRLYHAHQALEQRTQAGRRSES